MSRTVIGVDLGGTNLRVALLSADGEIIVKKKEVTRSSEGWKTVVAQLVENIERLREVAVERGLSVAAVGVGAPGVIKMEKGIVVKSPNFPDWNNLPLRELLEKALQVPVIIENDANAAALGEQWRGAGRGINSMILLTLGTGVGGGIVLDSRIWQGADGMAGEIGHMTLIPDGRQCGCGNTGCLEMYASARGIVLSYREALLQTGTSQAAEVTSAQIYKAARDGDSVARSVMKDMGRMLGIGIASLINIFNPQMIVIGGGVKDAWELFIGSTREEVMRRAFQVPAERTEIVPSMLGDDAGIVGAAATALHLQNTQSGGKK
ncbi:MAG TPA: ROK family protein [Nitrospirota bacterium]|nr:ROK family protein [Nitrospirota bacterium]